MLAVELVILDVFVEDVNKWATECVQFLTAVQMIDIVQLGRLIYDKGRLTHASSLR